MNPDPLKQFSIWFGQAESAAVPMPEAMTLATSDGQGRVSARIVLLRGVDDRGFCFYTNYDSRKGQDLSDHPFAALVFYWQPLSRQVRIEGTVERLTEKESDAYFASRPRGHQLSAHASPQSQVIKERSDLEQRFVEIETEFHDRDVTRPAHWGGYRVVPDMIEFWQEGAHRLHDRLRYRRDQNNDWIIARLAP